MTMIHLRLAVTLFTLFFVVQLYGQEEQLMESTKDQFRSGGMSPSSTSTIYGVNNRTAQVMGDYYLDKNWEIGMIDFYPYEVKIEGRTWTIDTIRNEQIRFNIKGNELEINTKYGVKIIDGSKVRSFRQGQGARVINGKELGLKTKDRRFAFFQEWVTGAVPLYSKYEVFERKPTYIPAFDVGDSNTQIIKKEMFYILEGKKLIKVRNNFSGIHKSFIQYEKLISNYISQNKLDPSNKTHLIQIFNYYNQLMAMK